MVGAAAKERDAATGGGPQTRDQLQQGGFSGSIIANNRCDSGAEVKI
jgi:hypothetical protein